MAFLYQILREPLCEGGGFQRDYLDQEKDSLKLNIDALFNDKSLYAQRRCIEEMCRGTPYALPCLGNPRDFHGIQAVDLLQFQARRAMAYFEEADASLSDLNRLRLFPARLMGRIYRRMLEQMIKSNFPAGGWKPSLSKWAKLREALLCLINT